MTGGTGWKLPGYVVDELIGYGASAEVWRAHRARTGEPVAVKRFVLTDAAQRRAANAEAALLGALEHPHLVRLHEVVAAGESVTLVLELAVGGSLADLLARRGRLGVGEVVTALSPVAAALAYAHDEGVTHCDVSPANVLFTADGRPLLADLGVARIVGHGALPHGTPAYVDPVVAAGAAPGPPTDVFGLAAVALHALTGTPPWPGASSAASIALAVDGDIPGLAERLRALPEPVADVIARGLSAEPHRRGTAADFALDLRHAARPVPVELSAGRAVRGPDSIGRHAATSHSASLRDAVPPDGAVPSDAGGLSGDGGPSVASYAAPSPGLSPARSPETTPPPSRGTGVPLDRPAWRHDAQDGPDADAAARVLATRQVPSRLRAELAADPPSRVREWSARVAGRLSRPVLVRSLTAAIVVLTVLGGAWFAVSRWWPGPGPAAAGARPSVRTSLLAPEPTSSAAGSSAAGSSAAGSATAGSATRSRSGQPSPSSPSSPSRTSSASSATGPPDFAAVLAALDRSRVLAYTSGDPAGLAAVYTPGELLTQDRATLSASVPHGCSLTGAATTYRSVTASPLTAGRWRVLTQASLAAGSLLCGQREVGRTAAAGPVPMTLEVIWTPAGWRIAGLTVGG